MKIVATIEARMTSSRLPGKTLLPAAGMPMLEHLVRRLRAVPSIDAIVLATTVNAADAPLVELANRLGIAAFRGDEDDVMQRVIDAAAFVNADVVVEITGDCPIIDPEIVEQTIRMFKAHRADYVSNALVRSYPDGMDTQVFRLETLRRSAAMTNDRLDREHVTLHIRNHPELFSHVHLVATMSCSSRSSSTSMRSTTRCFPAWTRCAFCASSPSMPRSTRMSCARAIPDGACCRCQP
jgi:spore coat polysaccharide biosynthesis protein SpsF